MKKALESQLVQLGLHPTAAKWLTSVGLGVGLLAGVVFVYATFFAK